LIPEKLSSESFVSVSQSSVSSDLAIWAYMACS
jgi:hypothetical protein